MGDHASGSCALFGLAVGSRHVGLRDLGWAIIGGAARPTFERRSRWPSARAHRNLAFAKLLLRERRLLIGLGGRACFWRSALRFGQSRDFGLNHAVGVVLWNIGHGDLLLLLSL